MAFVLKDRVKETTSTSGTGSVTLLGAVQGFQGFSSVGDGNTTYYTIAGVAEWEVGIGTYSAGILSRDTVLASSANGDKVAFSSGVKDVFCTYAAGKAIAVDTLSIAIANNANSPNDTTNVSSIISSVSTSDGDLALIAKGGGALLAQVPDGTATGGNKRGQYAVDLQRIRIASANVASGLASTLVGGYSNQASASYASVVGGYVNQASGTYAVVGGGGGNVASNQSATVAGGLSNTASGLNSSIGGGTTNTASASESSVVGGSNNTANSVASTVVGGVYGTTRGIVGYVSVPACSIPIASKAGVSQAGLLNLGRQTTTSASVVLRSDANAAGAANQLILANNSAIHFSATVVAYVTGGGNSKSWTFSGLIKRGANAAATTLVGSGGGSTYADAGAFTWDAVLSADTTNGGLAVTVTGQAATTIRWVCKIETTEVAY